jgi:putative transcriptional regulator
MRNIQRFGFIAILWGLLMAAGLAETSAAGTGLSVANANPNPSASPATGMFLLARRNLPDSNFSRTLVLLLRHGETGTLGLVVNRPTRVKLSEAIPHIEGADDRERLLFWGGPVARNQVLFLLRDDRALDLSEHLVDNIYVSTHPELLEKLFEDDRSERDLRVFAGYASWSAGQLAAELSRGDWHLLSIDAQIVFSMQIESVWETLIDRKDPKGILVYNHPGHADDLIVRDPRFRPDES